MTSSGIIKKWTLELLQDVKTQHVFFLLEYLLNPITLAIIFSLLFILLLPNKFYIKYKISLIKQEPVPAKHYFKYNDFNHDGQLEKVEIISPWNGQTAVVTYVNGKVQNQINLPGEFIESFSGYWHDIDHDGNNEFFIFTLYKNYLLLHCYSPANNKLLLVNRFISKYKKINNTIDLGIIPIGYFDVNGDQIKEFYFSIITGFTVYPRRVFAMDVAHDSLYASPNGCVNLLCPFAMDLDGDGNLEITGSTQAIANCASDKNLSDHYTWLIVFNKDLKFKFAPQKIGPFPAKFFVCPLLKNKEYFLVGLNIYEGTDNSPCSLSIFNAEGKYITQKTFPFDPDWKEARLAANASDNKTFFIIHKNGLIEELNKDLQQIRKIKYPALSNTGYLKLKMDGGKIWYILRLKNLKKLLVVDEHFGNPFYLDFDVNKEINYVISHKSDKGRQIIIASPDFTYYFDFAQNNLYYYRFPIYLAIFIFFTFIFSMLQRSIKYRFEKIYEDRRKISELQLKSIKNQLNPHFTFNILNSIGALFQINDKQQAEYLFNQYSTLLRRSIIHSDEFEISLSEEIEYVQNYLELEKFRLNGLFTYEITLDQNLSAKRIKIPKMLILTFVENAVKHGLRHLKKQGRLMVEARKYNGFVLIRVEDNGIGREQAKMLSQLSTGRGLKVLDQILDLYYSLKNIKITYSFSDKYDDAHQPLGTEVHIKIPIQ